MSAETVLFYVYATVAVAGALGLVLARSLVHAVMGLFATLFSIAALYLLLGNEFLAAMQLFVYGGAVTVLVLFVLMLARPGTEEARRITGPQTLAALVLCGVFFVHLAVFVGTAAWSPATAHQHDTASLATIMFSRYALPFEAAGLALTVALIGAILLARDEPPIRARHAEGGEAG